MSAITTIPGQAIGPATMTELMRLAEHMAKSRMFGINNESQAVSLMMLAAAEGLHPAAAMRDYHVINGRPALKADAMLARFQQAGGSVEWLEYTDECVRGVFSHKLGGSVTIEWNTKRLQQAGLNSENHRKYPRQMKRARCISEGVRAVLPGVCSGLYTPEEVVEFGDTRPAAIEPMPERAEPDNHEPPEVQAEVVEPAPAPKPDTPSERLEAALKFLARTDELTSGVRERIAGLRPLLEDCQQQELDEAVHDAAKRINAMAEAV